MIVIRKATPEDAAGMKRVQKLTWRATYPSPENGVSHEDIEGRIADWETPGAIADLRERITNMPEQFLRLVAVSDNEIVGNSMFEKTDDVNRMNALYVLPDYQGQRVGLKLASAGLKWLGADKDVALEVAKYNQKAIKFYQRLGFSLAGDAHIEVAALPSGATIPNYQMIKRAR